MEKPQLEEYMNANKDVLNEAVGFEHHTLAIAAGMAAMRIRWLEAALEEAISLIKQWHDKWHNKGEQAVGNEVSEAWKVYCEHSPKMKQLIEALTRNPSDVGMEVTNEEKT